VSIESYTEEERNGDDNGLDSLKMISIKQYLNEKKGTMHLSIVHSREFRNSTEIHRRNIRDVPSNSFSKDNEKSQPQPQKKGRASLTDSGNKN